MTITIKNGAGVDATVATPDEVAATLVQSLGAPNETSALQDNSVSGIVGLLKRLNGHLTSFKSLFPSALGPSARASSLSVTIATNDPLLAAIGTTADADPGADTSATATVIGWFKRLSSRLTSLISLVTAGNASLAALVADTSTPPIAYNTNLIYAGTTALTPKFAAIAAATSGNNTLVAAVTGKKIRVLAYKLTGSGAVNAKFQSGAGGTDLTGLEYIAAAGGGVFAGFNPVGHFETAAGVLLNINLSGSVAVGGHLTYVEI